MNDMEKIRVLLPHWIDHTRVHGEEFAHWAQHAREAGGTDAAEALEAAHASLRQSLDHLHRALDLSGGPLDAGTAHEHDHQHGHVHHHHHHKH